MGIKTPVLNFLMIEGFDFPGFVFEKSKSGQFFQSRQHNEPQIQSPDSVIWAHVCTASSEYWERNHMCPSSSPEKLYMISASGRMYTHACDTTSITQLVWTAVLT